MHMYIYPATHITYQHDANMINRSTLHLWEVGGGPLKLLRFQRQGFGPSTSKSWAKCARLRHKMGMGRKPEYKTIFIMYYTIYIYTYVYYIHHMRRVSFIYREIQSEIHICILHIYLLDNQRNREFMNIHLV